MISIPRNPNHCAPRRFGFCSAVSVTRVSFSTLSSSSIGCHFHHTVAAPLRRAFVVRAEANSEAESAVEEASEAEVEAVVESNAQPEEEKAPRKPRVKLGDVMGVIVLSIHPIKEHKLFCSSELRSTGFLLPEVEFCTGCFELFSMLPKSCLALFNSDLVFVF